MSNIAIATAPNRTLWEISADMLRLDYMLSDLRGDVTDEQIEAEFDAWFKELGDELDSKLGNYRSYMSFRQQMAASRTAEAERLSALAITDTNIVNRLKKRIQLYLESTGQKKVEFTKGKFWIQNNGGAEPVEITPEAESHPEELPEQYRRVKYDVDTEEIRTQWSVLVAVEANLRAETQLKQKCEQLLELETNIEDARKQIDEDSKTGKSDTAEADLLALHSAVELCDSLKTQIETEPAINQIVDTNSLPEAIRILDLHIKQLSKEAKELQDEILPIGRVLPRGTHLRMK